jgi:hypothetical protein
VNGKIRGPQSGAKTIQPLPPHTTTLGYGHPGYISNTPPPLATQPTQYQSYAGRVPTPQPTPYQSYASLVLPTPYSHHASFTYGNQSQSSSMGTSVRGIKTRNSISRKDLHWKGETTGFATYKSRLFGIMQQNGTSYLGNGDFLNEYIAKGHHIHSGTFWDRFGITAQQCMNDISWLMGVLSTTIDDPDMMPELNSAKGDGVIALANLISVYSNNGETEQDTRWNVRDEINTTFDPSQFQ